MLVSLSVSIPHFPTDLCLLASVSPIKHFVHGGHPHLAEGYHLTVHTTVASKTLGEEDETMNVGRGRGGGRGKEGEGEIFFTEDTSERFANEARLEHHLKDPSSFLPPFLLYLSLSVSPYLSPLPPHPAPSFLHFLLPSSFLLPPISPPFPTDLPLLAGISPIKHFVHGGHPLLAEGYHIPSCHDSIVYTRVISKTLTEGIKTEMWEEEEEEEEKKE